MSYPLVSVIIPVYQAENFVTECIRSVQAQNYPELEIILVDDGSTDCSGQMCEESAAADPRIRVLHQNVIRQPLFSIFLIFLHYLTFVLNFRRKHS